MAKKNNSRVIGRGVDYINNKETAVKVDSPAVTNIPNVYIDTGAAQNTDLLKSYQNYGAVQGNPTTTTQTTTSPLGTTQSQLKTGTSGTVKSYQQSFTPSQLTKDYLSDLEDIEDERPDAYVAPERPGPYESKYESTINDILNTINNRQPFDVNNDANYSALYDQYAERYKAQAQRAMNDAMASASGLTGGYGSTYGQAVGQQAYDRTMEGLNDQNLALMNLAYKMYSDDRNNDYNKLNAYQSADNTSYSRYRDDMSDWESDRNFGYNQYRDEVGDWQNDRNYYANQYWNSYGTDRSGYENDRSFDYGMDVDQRNFDYQSKQDEMNRDDALYEDALKQAMSLSQAGLPVPDYITARINQYNQKYGLGSGDTTSYLQQLAALALSDKGSGGSGGGGRRKGSSKKKSSKETDTEVTPTVNYSDYVDTLASLKKAKDEANGSVLYDGVDPEEYAEFVRDNYKIDMSDILLRPIQTSMINSSLAAKTAAQTVANSQKRKKK